MGELRRRWREHLHRLRAAEAADERADLALVREVLAAAAADARDLPVAVRVLEAAAVLAPGRGLLAQRAVEQLWHVLFAGNGEPVRWHLQPGVHALHLDDLAGWEDSAPLPDVAAALERAAVLADAQIADAT
ncbi:hypothetical protein GCM10009836_54090 [Pseudonocardia ailaonensis]|uniref:Uncharacterized protein n=1 Tax=Pseudonocardia ailaonensis TaxID=367279 RepID=A0ABN2NIJ2_9PSEU